MAKTETLSQRSARLLRKDAHAQLGSQLYLARRECEDAGGIDAKVSLAHAEAALGILTAAIAQYTESCNYADQLATSEVANAK